MDQKKKLLIISGITSAVLLIVIVIVLVAVNGNKGNKVSYDDGKTYKVKMELPKEKNEYKFITNDGKETENELESVFSDFAIVSDKVNIEFEKKTYVFQEAYEYIEKYGKENPNFANFKKYINDKEINGDLYTNIKEIKLNGVEGIQYVYKDTVIIVLNTDKIDTNTYISIRVYLKDENEDINKIIESQEIQEILNTIKFSKK